MEITLPMMPTIKQNFIEAEKNIGQMFIFGSSVANSIKNARYAIIMCEITLKSPTATSAHSLGGCAFVLILENGVKTSYSGLTIASNTRRDYGIEDTTSFIRDIEFNPSADGTWSFMYTDKDNYFAERPDFDDSRIFVSGYYSD